MANACFPVSQQMCIWPLVLSIDNPNALAVYVFPSRYLAATQTPIIGVVIANGHGLVILPPFSLVAHERLFHVAKLNDVCTASKRKQEWPSVHFFLHFFNLQYSEVY
jgi:hypothetical protein